MFWTVPLSIIRSFSLYTQQRYMSHRLRLQLVSRIRTEPVPSWSCWQTVSTPVWHIQLLCVQWKTPDDGQRHCLKHVEFYSKNKFEKLVHLVGYIIRIFYEIMNYVNAIPHLKSYEMWQIRYVLNKFMQTNKYWNYKNKN